MADEKNEQVAGESGVIDFNAETVRLGDHLVRGTAAEGQVRAFAITARASVQELHDRHQTSPVVSAALGRLLMAGMMMGAMSKNDDELITLVVHGEGPVGGLTVTANNHGQAKGFANHPHVWLPLNGVGKLDVGSAVAGESHVGTLSVIHDLPGMDPYSSEVALVSGEIGDDLTYYFAASDQVPTSLGVGVLVDTDQSIRQAGGFIVQLMPGCDDAVVDRLEANLSGVRSVTDLLEAGMKPTDILGHVLDGLTYQELDAMPVEFHCGCNRDRAARAVLALGRAELEDMISKGEPADVYCHFCGEHYRFEPDELSDLLG
ncbi:molecular chaperone Hsp33 [Olsenella sp. KH3B4]|uniref:Hsp33 family molecular chaperone HslO n=1 Tax=Olsenella sp. KH3B4 TaxID=1855394 RepID=UPI0008B87903|nr:Hsp33 family molecular chaperone HslO [Olsenella sp. KH3B4]SES70422.1 molecular chaperone Hsp33 [Olsenella sp. KH3B4]